MKGKNLTAQGKLRRGNLEEQNPKY